MRFGKIPVGEALVSSARAGWVSNSAACFLNGCLSLMRACWPQACVLCGAAAGGATLCPPCMAELPWLPRSRCPVCALPAANGAACGACLARPRRFDRVEAPFAYRYPVAGLIHALKYGGRLALARMLGEAQPHTTTAGVSGRFMGTKVPNLYSDDWDVDGRIRDMDEEGVDVELILVQNAEDTGIAWPEGVQVVVAGKNLGIPGGRNVGAALATGELLLFLDDDAVLALVDLGDPFGDGRILGSPTCFHACSHGGRIEACG